MYEVLFVSVPLWLVITSAVLCSSIVVMLVRDKSSKSVPTNTSSNGFKQPVDVSANHGIRNDYTLLDGTSKLVLCVNMSLGMGKGKIGAQCGHATLGAYKMAKKYGSSCLTVWETLGQAKIAVKVDSEDSMFNIEERAKAKGLITYIVQDAGRTQIAAGSRTVLAIGPAPVHMFSGVTDDLKLL